MAISEFRQAVCTWSAPEAQQVDIELEKLTAQRAEALAGTRRAGDGFAAFSASKCEALLSVQIRQLRREGGAA